MKKETVKRLICILLSGLLFASGVEAPLYAFETEELYQAEMNSQETISEEEIVSTDEEATAVEPKSTVVPTETETEQTIENTISTEVPTEEENDIIPESSEAPESSLEEENEELSDENAFPSYSKFVVNPLYEDLLDLEQLKSEIASLQNANTPTADADAFQNVQQAADYVHSQMVQRSNLITFYIPAALISSQDAFSALVEAIVANADGYTEDYSGQESDTLLRDIKAYRVESAYDANTHNYLLTYTISYYTASDTEYPMAAVSDVDESAFDDPLNVANPNVSFTTLDDQTVSSAADGKPMLIVFFKVGCYNSQSTLNSIANDSTFPDVDVYAVEINKNTKDSVSAFKTTYGSDDIVFSYDTSNGNSTSLWSYMSAAGLVSGGSFSATLPVICYIDANNQLQYITQGLNNASVIKANLAHYCNAPVTVDTYNITYILNGGTNNSANPATYQPTSATIILQDPVKDGYTFAGWYLDSGFTIQITQIEQGNSSDIRLYAKWEKKPSSEGKKLNLDNPEFDFTTISEDIVTSTADKKTKLLVFFSSNCGNSRSTIQSIAQNEFSDVDLYAIDVNSSSKEKVTSFKNTYGNDHMIFSYDTLYGNQTYLNRYIELADFDGMAMPIICYIDSNNKFQFITEGYSSADTIRANIRTYCDTTVSDTDTPQVDMTLTAGNILMGFSGTYYTETADKILNRLNEIRLEACREGVINPSTNQPLTEADYVPLQWSSDLEAITRLRAAEATVAQSHTRPNGTRCFTVKTTNNQQSWAENLAWNNSGLMEGIKQWYGEKSDWVNQTGETTGHYTSIINPEYRHVAVSAFRLASGGWYAIAQEFSPYSSLDSKKDDTAGKCIQYMEITGSSVTSLQLDAESSPLYIEKGNTAQLSLNATITHEDYYGTAKTFTGPVKEGGVWSSSDESVASVETNGLITTKKSGTAEITVSAGTASATLNIVVYEPQELVEYTISYDVQGHGIAPADDKVKPGGTITPPKEPAEDGYVFKGWYKDSACTAPWNFDTDFVQANTILYAKWLIASGTQTGFHIQEISDMVYTGKPCKPTVSVYDGEMQLKANKDYTLSYYNNTNVNSVKKKGSGTEDDFNESLPYVKITGKGNYTKDDLSMNFNILPAALADGQGNPAKGVTVQYTEQTVSNTKKPIAPFRSVKYGKTIKINEDFQLSLKTITAFDQSGKQVANGTALDQAAIPAGYTGSFALTVTGIGNYTGTLRKTVYAADKAHLLKNAKITLGKNLKSVSYQNYKGAFTPAYYDNETKKYYLVKVNDGKTILEAADTADIANVFTVSIGKSGLIYGQDFDVVYETNGGVGKAQLTVVGKGQYIGRKSAPFKITGTALTANAVKVTLKNKTYTGRAQTQNEAVLIPKDPQNGISVTPLRYGIDYTIRYKNIVNKGTASMTFIALQGSAYSGSFTKTFKIEPADLSDPTQVTQGSSMKNIVAEYEKAGAKPSDKIMLTNMAGMRLQNGKDYTISYANNKSVSSADDHQSAMMIIKGKGNYTGKLEIPFTITKGRLDHTQITMSPVAYNAKRDAAYEYKPSVKLIYKGSSLSAKTDYEIAYENNTQAAYESYLQKFKSGTATDENRPAAVITAKESSNYTSNTFRVPLPIYEHKLSKKNLHVVVEDAVYSGTQLKPNVSVYYSDDPSKITVAKNLTNEKEILALGLEKLTLNTHYTLSYGANIAAGKNKGRVKIRGSAPLYGGDLTVQFTIQNKKVTW